MFEVLTGDLTVESGELRQVGGRQARAFTAAWTLPADTPQQPDYQSNDAGRTWTKPITPTGTQLRLSLWLDTISLLPVLSEVTSVADPQRGLPSTEYSRLSVEYNDTIDIQPPSGVTPPDCIP